MAGTCLFEWGWERARGKRENGVRGGCDGGACGEPDRAMETFVMTGNLGLSA